MAELITRTGIPHWLQPLKLDRSDFYPEIVWETVLRRLQGGETLTSVCTDPTMPNVDQMRRWIFAEEDRKNRYYESREIGAEKVEDEILAIADGTDKQNEILEDVQRSALRIGTRRWLLGVWNRRRYGDTKQVDVTHKVDLVEAMEKASQRVEGRQEKVIEGTVTNG